VMTTQSLQAQDRCASQYECVMAYVPRQASFQHRHMPTYKGLSRIAVTRPSLAWLTNNIPLVPEHMDSEACWHVGTIASLMLELSIIQSMELPNKRRKKERKPSDRLPTACIQQSDNEYPLATKDAIAIHHTTASDLFRLRTPVTLEQASDELLDPKRERTRIVGLRRSTCCKDRTRRHGKRSSLLRYSRSARLLDVR
jgi:hypothetical protein